MPKQIIKYQCNFCIKSWVSKKRAEAHEAKCFRNPAARSCWTCIFTYDSRHKDESPWCLKMDKEIYVSGSPVCDCPNWNNGVDFDVEEWLEE